MQAVKWAPIAGVKVVGITGHARHGKDTLARELLFACRGAERFAFSDGIAAMLRAAGEMSIDRDPPKMQERGYAVRQARPTAWLDVVYGAIADRRPAVAVITGIRFEDEADIVRQMGGIMIRVVRRDASGDLFQSPDRPHDHPVEQAVSAISTDEEIVIGPGELETLAVYAADLRDRLR